MRAACASLAGSRTGSIRHAQVDANVNTLAQRLPAPLVADLATMPVLHRPTRSTVRRCGCWASRSDGRVRLVRPPDCCVAHTMSRLRWCRRPAPVWYIFGRNVPERQESSVKSPASNRRKHELPLLPRAHAG
jgi:hypothetical protein